MLYIITTVKQVCVVQLYHKVFQNTLLFFWISDDFDFLLSILSNSPLTISCRSALFRIALFLSFYELLGYAVPSVLNVIAASRISACLELLSSTSPILLILQLLLFTHEAFFVCFNTCALRDFIAHVSERFR